MINMNDFNGNGFGDDVDDNDESFIAKRGKAIIVNNVD